MTGLKRISAPSALMILIFAGLFLAAVVPAQAQASMWTDKGEYYVGETVAIHVNPVPVIAGAYHLTVLQPDGSSEVEMDLDVGQGTATYVAGPPPGPRRVELWIRGMIDSTPPARAILVRPFPVRASAQTCLAVAANYLSHSEVFTYASRDYCFWKHQVQV